MKTVLFPPGVTVYAPPKDRAVSYWRLFNFGMLVLMVDLAGRMPYFNCLEKSVTDLLLDSKRKRPRAHIPFGFVSNNMFPKLC